jgi:hypothetical protein
MTTNLTILSAFNNQLLFLFNFVKQLFPDDNDINTAILILQKMKKTNPRLLILSWKECFVKPYRTEIEKGDINFLITKDYNYDLQDYDTTGIIREKIETLREPVKNMNPQNQSTVIQITQKLTQISDLYKYNN